MFFHVKQSLLVTIAAIFSCSYAPHPSHDAALQACYGVGGAWEKPVDQLSALKKLGGPYAAQIRSAALQAHVPPRLVAAVAYIENGRGNFQGAANRVSPAGAIGVMQLMPSTAWDMLHVDPWDVRQNIEGAAKYLSYLLRQFHGNEKLAVMAYNAGPTAIARGYRPIQAVVYARQVMRSMREI